MNRQTILALVLFGVAFFIVRLAMTTPAQFVLGHVANNVPNLKVQGVQGTLWNGKATNVSVVLDGNTTDLGETQWVLSALPLLWGSASLQLSAHREKQSIDVNAVLGLGGSLTLENSDIALPADMLRQWAPVPVELGGMLSARINELEVNEQAVDALDGTLTWQDAEVNMTGVPVVLGSYVAEVSAGEDGRYQANVFDLGGAALGIKGTAAYTPESKDYEVDVVLELASSLDSTLKSMIQQLGKADSKGRIQFKQQGKI